MQKAYKESKTYFSYRQSIGVCGMSCYLRQYSFFPSHRQKSNWKVKICKIAFSQKLGIWLLSYCTTLITQQTIIENAYRSFFNEDSLMSLTNI